MEQAFVFNATDYWIPLVRLVIAMAAGALIGLERTFSGRFAGLRTHTLVATASSLLMLFTVFQFDLLSGAPLQSIRADPTRMAQGIMTGIGFLGAGVIVREGITVRGLTTAASIWMTSAIGILIGIGFYSAALIAEAIALGVLSLFRLLELVVPRLFYARLTASFPGSLSAPLPELETFIKSHGVRVSNVSYSLEENGGTLRYGMTLSTRHTADFRRLAEALATFEQLQEFSIVPTWE